MVYLNGRMEENMNEIIKKIKKKDLEFIIGRMEEFLEEIGSMENNMAKENFMTQEREYGKKENGKMEKKLCFMNKIEYKYMIVFIFSL